MKTEPHVFSIDDLKKDKTSLWDGVRNYQARNFMRDDMNVGDHILIYHSNAKPPGIAGIATVSKANQVDPTALNKKSEYYDPKATPENPRWYCVEVKFKAKFKHFVALNDIREQKALEKMLVVQKGQRLSIQPVKKSEFELLEKMGQSH